MKILLSIVFFLFFIFTAVVSAAPATPTDLRVTGVSANSVSLQWTPAADAKDLRHYLVTYSDGTDDQTQKVPVRLVTDRTTTITGLTTKTPYTFTVAACVSDADCSAPSAAVPGTPEGAAGKKNLGQLCDPTKANECSVGECTPFFKLTLSLGGICIDPTAGDTHADLSGITPEIAMTAVTGNSVTLTVNNASRDIAAYAVYYKKKGETEWSKPQVFQAPNFTVTGLANNTEYVFSVFGFNQRGTTSNSEELPVTTTASAEVATSCTIADCNGIRCSRLNPAAKGGSYCNITSQKGDPLSCECGPPPPSPFSSVH